MGRISLRRKQFQLAVSGNTALLIFLGKQREWLSQADRIEQTSTVDATIKNITIAEVQSAAADR